MMKVQRVSEIIFCYLIPLVFLGAFLHSSVTEIQYGLHRDYAEGTTLAYIEHWRTHASEPRSIYSPEAMMPGQVMGYPFLHLGLVSLFSQDASQALMIGRSLSVICALLVSIVAWLILRRTLHLSLKYLPLLTTLIIYQSAVFDWSLLARSDLLAYLFEILGLYFYLSEWDQKDKTHWKTLFLFAASFCCKQNYILGPLVVIALECIYNKKNFFRKAPLYI
ncbi:MAG: hypothetical protein J7501_18030, partial [Bdellovibrio sp.]|nr:hypothetical protein [Bdellovibrio sp.]